MERKTESRSAYYNRQQQLNEMGDRVKSHSLVSRLTREDRKANLTLSVAGNIKGNYGELSKWEKIFVQNFYEGKPRPTGKDRVAKVRADIEKEFERLIALAEDEEYFKIDSENNEFLDREFEGEINALISRGQVDEANYYKNNAAQAKREMAEKYSQTLQAEYKHIVDFIKSTNYESAFKVLMLRETLLKTYTRTKDDDEEKTITKPRVEHKTIASHMTLNADVLNTVYNELDKYTSFANLYFAGIAISNKTIAGKNTISLTGVDTFGKGKWIKFEGKTSNKDKYIKNAQELAALVQETPWCTKTLASSQLEQGDFYVFVDNAGKPHIAVKMSGNTVDEVRGLKGGNAQELEEDYRDVAVEFLHKNPEVKDGDKWLAKEEWNARLINYNKLIESGQAGQIDIGAMMDDYLNKTADYKTHGGYGNSNKTALLENIKTLRPQITSYYSSLTEIRGSVKFELTDITTLEKLKSIGEDADFFNSQITDLGNLQSIGGNANFYDSQITDLGNLQSIGGDVVFTNSQITDLGNLQSIGGEADFIDSQITSLGNLQSIGGDAYIKKSQITDLGNLQSIGGNAYFEKSKIINLGNLQSIGGGADFSRSQITSLGNLQSIGGRADFRESQITSLDNLQSIGGNVVFTNSQITSLDNLQSIGGNVVFTNSQITSLDNLQSIGGDVVFTNSQITDLGNLQSIGGSALFENSQITDLGNLQSIGGTAYFEKSKIINLGNLQSIGGWADFSLSQITDLVNLQSIGGGADFSRSKITDLGNLQSIGGNAYFENSQIKDFGNLQSIGGKVQFGDNKELEQLFHQQFKKEGNGWMRIKTAKADDNLGAEDEICKR